MIKQSSQGFYKLGITGLGRFELGATFTAKGPTNLGPTWDHCKVSHIEGLTASFSLLFSFLQIHRLVFMQLTCARSMARPKSLSGCFMKYWSSGPSNAM